MPVGHLRNTQKCLVLFTTPTIDILTPSFDFKFYYLSTFHTTSLDVYSFFFSSVFKFLLNVSIYSVYVIFMYLI